MSIKELTDKLNTLSINYEILLNEYKEVAPNALSDPTETNMQTYEKLYNDIYVTLGDFFILSENIKSLKQENTKCKVSNDQLS